MSPSRLGDTPSSQPPRGGHPRIAGVAGYCSTPPLTFAYTLRVRVITPPPTANDPTRGEGCAVLSPQIAVQATLHPGSMLLYDLPLRVSGARVSLRVPDVLGRLVKTLVDRHESSGPCRIVWNGKDEPGRRIPSGMYCARLTVGGLWGTEKITIVT